jgi:ATP:corrinoid adenosyltransferase
MDGVGLGEPPLDGLSSMAMLATAAERPPLWRAMKDAGFNASGTPRDAIAAEILALRDWLGEVFADEIPAQIYNLLTAESLDAEKAGPPAAVKPAAFQLTADQQAAIEGILEDITKASSTPVLCGYAGTGKTVTTAALVSRLASMGKRVVVATPTHKARSQVERALARCGAEGFEAVTVARLLGLKQVRDRQTGKETFKPDSAGKNMLSKIEEWNEDEKEMVKIRRIDVVIVDETSMLSSDLYDLLLRELKCRPVVFVGDDRQLLPVGEDQACKAFTEGSSLYRLTEVLRHDGAILNLATATRHLAVGRARFASADGDGSRVVSYRSRERWGVALLEMAASHEAMSDPDFCRALAWSNDSVNMINTRIHQRRYGMDAPQFVEGMTCVTVDAIPDPMGAAPLLNSTVDVLIEEAIRGNHRFSDAGDLLTDEPWDTWELTVTGDFSMAKTFCVIAAEDEQRWQKWLKDIADQARDASGQRRSELWDLFFRRKDCVGKLQPASALTVHKSQGSTFQHVFLHWDIDGRGSQPTATQNQLSYVGITRAAESLHVVGDR